MGVDFGRALKSPFSGEGWQIKILVPFAAVIFGALLQDFLGKANPIGAIYMLAYQILITGYMAIYGHNIVNKISDDLPEWNISKAFSTGFFAFIIVFAYLLALLPAFIIIFMFKSNLPLVITLGLVVAFVILLFQPIIISMFYERLKLQDAFNFVKLSKIIKEKLFGYVGLLFIAIGLGIIYGIGFGIVIGFLQVFLGKTAPLVTGLNNYAFGFIVGIAGTNAAAQLYQEILEDLNYSKNNYDEESSNTI